MSRILIAVPTYENIYPDTFKSIYELEKGDNEVDFDFFRGYDVANARNVIAQATIDKGYDYVLMVDSDEVLPKDALINLLESEQKYMEHNMVLGYCLSRPRNSTNTSGRTTVFKFGRKDYVVGVKKLQVRGGGLAPALIHRSVFEKMEYPYFKWTDYKSRAQLSEDLYFCEKFRSIKIPIFVDTRVACGHLMRHIDYI